MSWRVARSLDTLLAEINAAAPHRDKAADGSIGDASHSSRYSDHNPNAAGVVRARDFTHDPAGGCHAGEIAEAVRALGAANGHPALGPGAYVIWNWRIASDTYGWVWRDYTGSNGHTHHCHVSVATSASGYDSTAPWGITEEDPMAQFTEADIKRIVGAAVDAKVEDIAVATVEALMDFDIIPRKDIDVRDALRHGSAKRAEKAKNQEK